MASNIRAIHKRKASSINRSFVGGFPERRVLFSDGAHPALAITAPPVVAGCSHPFASMKISGWTISTSGNTLRLDAVCEACGVRYSKGVSADPGEEMSPSAS